MSAQDRRVVRVDAGLDRLRSLQQVEGARIRGQLHRLEAHGLGDAARIIRSYIDGTAEAVTELDEAIAQLIATTDPSLEETTPIGLQSTRP